MRPAIKCVSTRSSLIFEIPCLGTPRYFWRLPNDSTMRVHFLLFLVSNAAETAVPRRTCVPLEKPGRPTRSREAGERARIRLAPPPGHFPSQPEVTPTRHARLALLRKRGRSWTSSNAVYDTDGLSPSPLFQGAERTWIRRALVHAWLGNQRNWRHPDARQKEKKLRDTKHTGAQGPRGPRSRSFRVAMEDEDGDLRLSDQAEKAPVARLFLSPSSRVYGILGG